MFPQEVSQSIISALQVTAPEIQGIIVLGVMAGYLAVGLAVAGGLVSLVNKVKTFQKNMLTLPTNNVR